MSVYCIVNQTMRLSDPTKKIVLHEPLAYSNTRAHAFRVTVLAEGSDEPADLTGVGVTGQFYKPKTDETVTPINGTVSGNVAEIILPASCYTTPGRFVFTMDMTQAVDPTGYADFSTSTSYSKGDMVKYNGVVYMFTANHSAGAWTGTDAVLAADTRTALWVDGVVERTNGGTAIDPGTPVGNIEQAIGAAQAAASAATAAAAEATEAAASAAPAIEVDGTTLEVTPNGNSGTTPVSGTTPTITATSGAMYVCTATAVSTLSFTPASSGLSGVRFTSGTSATVLTLPNTVKMPDWWTGCETNRTYEIIISDGVFGTVMSWAT